MSRDRAPHPPPDGIGFMISNFAVSVVQLGMSCFEVLIDTLELYPQRGTGNVGQTNNAQLSDDDYTTSSHPLHPRRSNYLQSGHADQPIHDAHDNNEDASIQSTQPDVFREQVSQCISGCASRLNLSNFSSTKYTFSSTPLL